MVLFECSICLSVLNQPVTVPCGHSFCYECLKQQVASRLLECALCKAPWPETNEFKPALDLRLVVRHHRKNLGLPEMIPDEQAREPIKLRPENALLHESLRQEAGYSLVERRGRGITTQFLARWPDGHEEWRMLTEVSDGARREWDLRMHRERNETYRRRQRANLRPRRRN